MFWNWHNDTVSKNFGTVTAILSRTVALNRLIQYLSLNKILHLKRLNSKPKLNEFDFLVSVGLIRSACCLAVSYSVTRRKFPRKFLHRRNSDGSNFEIKLNVIKTLYSECLEKFGSFWRVFITDRSQIEVSAGRDVEPSSLSPSWRSAWVKNR